MDEINIVKIKDADYPLALKSIPGAPKILYYKGVLPSPNEFCVAVVGTRRPSDYGQKATTDITGDLVDAGVIIISGLAPGIDTVAHQTCVQKGARTIAVLGSGLDESIMYPQENIELSRQILQNGGCLISEYPPTTPGYKNQFPRRNRIVSGLSKGVVVIEAKEKSGSLITAQLARLQKKKLFAVPGSIYTLNAKGPNKLIKEGATLVEHAQDILDVLEITSQKIANKKSVVADNETEKRILDVLVTEASYIDAIIKTTQLSPSAIATSLALMEISGKIRNLGGNIYSL